MSAPFSGPIEDRLAIREFYAAYSGAAMRQDREAYLDFWSEDGVRAAPDGEVCGKAAIAAHWDAIWQALERMGFFSEVTAIAVADDAATAQVFCREIIVFRDGRVWKVVGRYDDRLVRKDGVWRFARRDYQVMLNEGG